MERGVGRGVQLSPRSTISTIVNMPYREAEVSRVVNKCADDGPEVGSTMLLLQILALGKRKSRGLG